MSIIKAGEWKRIIGASILILFAAAAGASPTGSQYPSRPITLIVPWGPGGGADQMAREVAKLLEQDLKSVSVPVVNAPGADGNSGMVKLINGAADGYTLAVLVADTFYDNVAAKEKAPWKLNAITPLAVMNRQPFAILVAKDSPFKTWADVERAAKGRELKIAIDGLGSAEDVLVNYLAARGLKLNAVPYPKPGERYAAVLGNHVDLLCDPDGNSRSYLAAGQMRALLVFGNKRVPEIKSAQTAAEVGYKVTLSEFRAIVVKAGTPEPEVRLLSEALARVYKSAQFQQFLKSTWSASDSYVSRKDVPGYLRTKQREMARLARGK